MHRPGSRTKPINDPGAKKLSVGTCTKKKITLELNETVYHLIEVLTLAEYAPQTVEGVIYKLIDHAQQGVYRPGAWEREWLCQAFGYDFMNFLEPGDPYGRP